MLSGSCIKDLHSSVLYGSQMHIGYYIYIHITYTA